MLSLLTLFKDLVFSVSAGFIEYFFKSELGGAEKFGILSSEFIDILLKKALKEVTENLIRDGREERLKQVWHSLLYV